MGTKCMKRNIRPAARQKCHRYPVPRFPAEKLYSVLSNSLAVPIHNGIALHPKIDCLAAVPGFSSGY